jgi:hypothetical protein
MVSIQSYGVIHVNWIFPTNHAETQRLALGEDRHQPTCLFKVFTFERRQSASNARFGITYWLRPTRKWSNTIIHANVNIRVVFLSSIECGASEVSLISNPVQSMEGFLGPTFLLREMKWSGPRQSTDMKNSYAFEVRLKAVAACSCASTNLFYLIKFS